MTEFRITRFKGNTLGAFNTTHTHTPIGIFCRNYRIYYSYIISTKITTLLSLAIKKLPQLLDEIFITHYIYYVITPGPITLRVALLWLKSKLLLQLLLREETTILIPTKTFCNWKNFFITSAQLFDNKNFEFFLTRRVFLSVVLFKENQY